MCKDIFLAFCFEIISDLQKNYKMAQKTHTLHPDSSKMSILPHLFSYPLALYFFSEQFEIGLQI